MTDILVLIGILFVIFSVISMQAILKGENEAARGVILAIWALLAFGLASWAISWFFMSGLNGAWSLSQSLHVPFLLVLASPILLLLGFSFLSKRKK